MLAPPAGMSILLVWQVVLGHPWGKQPMSNAALIVWTIFIWLLFARLITVRLVTDVVGDRVIVRMRGFWRSQSIPLSIIADATPVSFHPVEDYGGYGIRSTKCGKAYIAGGECGVRLKLRDGSCVLIGSHHSKQLAKVLCELVAPN
jgi:hypothetical protein